MTKVNNDQKNIILIFTHCEPNVFPHAPPGSIGPSPSPVLQTELAGGLWTFDSIRGDGEMGLSGSFMLGWPVYGACVGKVANLYPFVHLRCFKFLLGFVMILETS